MKNKYSFDSKYYSMVTFSDALSKCLYQDEVKRNLVLVSSLNIGIYDAREILDKCLLLSGQGVIKEFSDIQSVNILSDQDTCALTYVRISPINLEYENTFKITYAQVLHRILFETINVTEKMIVFIYDHLSHRTYEEDAIVKLDIIQEEYAYIIRELNIARVFFEDKKNNMLAISKCLTNIYIRLIKLSGARSLLTNSIMQFNYAFQIFRKIFLLTDESIGGA